METKSLCMICLEGGEDLVSLHPSSGTSHLVHHTCMQEWIEASHSLLCPLCTLDIHPHIYSDILDGDFLLRAATEDNWRLVRNIKMEQIPSDIILKALLTSAEQYHASTFYQILCKIADLPEPLEMNGFFEFFCGKQVPFHLVQMLHDFIKSLSHWEIDYEEALTEATINGSIELFEYLLEEGKGQIYQLDQGLLNAVLMENIDILVMIIKLDLYDKNLIYEAVSMACYSGQVSVLTLLENAGAWNPLADSVEQAEKNLQNAAEYGHLDVVRFLLTHCPAVEKVGDFASVCENGHCEVAKLLLDSFSTIDLGGEASMAISMAAGAGHVDLVRFLHDRGARIDANDNLGLQLASKNGHLLAVKYLVEEGADIHANSGYALRWAAKHGHLDVVQFLIGKGADPESGDGFAMREARVNRYERVVSYLEGLE